MSKKKIIIIVLISLICLCIGRYDRSNNTGSSILDWSNRSNGTGFYVGTGGNNFIDEFCDFVDEFRNFIFSIFN